MGNRLLPGCEVDHYFDDEDSAHVILKFGREFKKQNVEILVSIDGNISSLVSQQDSPDIEVSAGITKRF